MNVFVTGATGNVGQEVIKALDSSTVEAVIKAGVRNKNKAKDQLAFSSVELVNFDFNKPEGFEVAISDNEVLFLLRPPQISDINSSIKPIIDIAKRKNLKHIIFLSVQGVEDNTFIPHYKIEQLIIESKIPYTFLRPAYFMQNFTTTLHYELKHNKRIFLPAGNAKFSLIDVSDIGIVTANILMNLSEHQYKSYPLTTSKNMTFQEMADVISLKTGITVNYKSPNLLEFMWVKYKQQMPFAMILVMIMLHYLPRFRKAPEITECVGNITGRKPFSFEDFIEQHKSKLF